MTLLAYLDAALLMALMMTTLARYTRVICNPQVLATVVGVLLPLIVVDDLPVYKYLRAVTGDLSISSKLILLLVIYQRAAQHVLIDNQQWRWMRYSFALLGLFFYPFALGISMFDPYAHGYQAQWLVIAVVGIAALCAWRRWWWPSAMLLLALTAYAVGLLESDNLWDYLLDPLLCLYALFASCATLWRKYLSASRRAAR